MKSFLELKKNLKCDYSSLQAIKIAVMGDTSTQFLVQALRGTGFEYGFDLRVFEADFNQIEQQVFENRSRLHNFKPEIVILFFSTHKLLGKFNKLDQKHCNVLADDELALINNIYQSLIVSLNSKIIFYNYYEINDSVFGNYSNKIEYSFLFQLRKLNYLLMIFACQHNDFYICDLSTIQNNYGKNNFFQPSIYVTSEMVLSIDILPEIAGQTLDIIAAMFGKFKKCLILDLDNTLWGGVIGDDGLEKIQIGGLGIGKAYTEFQYWLKKLKNRGIILAVCSKNNEMVAREVFEKHPDMVLHMEDIAVFIANWGNKVDNIRNIQEILNIGFDSMVFLDDNPLERYVVKKNIPEIEVPELPEDTANYLEFLYTLNLFETVSHSAEDADRTKQYQVDTRRKVFKKSFTDDDEFLKSLDMISSVESFNKFNTPRVAQLTQRSNQFNLKSIRYSEEEIRSIADSKDYFTFAFTLEDKFGDNGLISVVILKLNDNSSMIIDTWLMSCRVINRGMERFVLNTIANFAKIKGFTYLVGEYIHSLKNEIVKDHYPNLGFKKHGDLWILNIAQFKNIICYIKNKKSDFDTE